MQNAARSKQDRRRALTFTDVVTLTERETASDLMASNERVGEQKGSETETTGKVKLTAVPVLGATVGSSASVWATHPSHVSATTRLRAEKERKKREQRTRRTDVEREVDRSVLTDVLERHLDDLADPVLVDVVHGEALDVCRAPEPSAPEKASPKRERETGAHCSP